MAYILVLLVNSVWGGMAVEFRNALLQVRQDIEDGRLDAAVERLDRLRGLVARDRWIDDTVLQKSHALIRFTSMPYDQIARAFSAALIHALRHSTALTQPFAMRTMDRVFPPRQFEFLSGNMPPQKFMEPRRDAHFFRNGAFQRYEMVLADQKLAGAGHTLRKLWLGLERALRLPATLRAFSAATGCRIPPDAILSVRLMVDRTGFAMQPHTDGGNGALVTFQTYFPAPGLPSDMGTEFFEKRGEAFELRLKRPYLPNHGHVFAVSDDSWHGVRTATPDTLEGRGSLVVRYFRKG